jgi:hypothetical protein
MQDMFSPRPMPRTRKHSVEQSGPSPFHNMSLVVAAVCSRLVSSASTAQLRTQGGAMSGPVDAPDPSAASHPIPAARRRYIRREHGQRKRSMDAPGHEPRRLFLNHRTTQRVRRGLGWIWGQMLLCLGAVTFDQLIMGECKGGRREGLGEAASDAPHPQLSIARNWPL